MKAILNLTYFIKKLILGLLKINLGIQYQKLFSVFAIFLTISLVQSCIITSPLLTSLVFADIRDEPGYVEIDYPGAKAKVEVNINDSLLNLAAHAVKDDPELQKILVQLRGLSIRIYENKDLPVDVTAEEIAEFYKQKFTTSSKKWDTLAKIRENGNITIIHALMLEETVRGLFVLVSEPENTIAVNLVGKIDLTQLNHLNEFTGVNLHLPNFPTKPRKLSQKKINKITDCRKKAILNLKESKLEEAISAFQRIHDIAGYSPADYAMLALLFREKGNLIKSYSYLAKAYDMENAKGISALLRDIAKGFEKRRE